MRSILPVTVGAAILLVLGGARLTAAEVQGEQAVLPDGRRVSGKLALESEGRLRFTTGGRPSSIALDGIHHVRFPSAEATPLRAGTIHRVLLHGGQFLTGELLDLDEKNLRLRTAWSDVVSVPRPDVAAVRHAPGFVTFFDEDFEDGLKPWQVSGKPAFGDKHTSGQRSLLLNAPDQAAEYTLAAPLEAGRAGVNFLEDEGTAGALWLVEAEFHGSAEPCKVRVTLAGNGAAYQATVPGIESEAAPVARKPGWHRLNLEFTAESLRVTVDEAVVWFTLKQGPGGSLRKVRLACVEGGTGARRGHVLFDDFSLARAVDEPRHPAEDLSQDEVWLLSGDQLFGKLLRADRRTVQLQTSSGKRTFAWGDMRGLFPARETIPLQTTDGEQVRIELRSGAATDTDQLEGVLKALDERRVLLQHPVLGKLEFERARLHQLRWLFHGKRIELDNDCHHLGAKGKLVPALYPPRAGGPSLRRTFHLEALPSEARLVVQVVQLKGPKDSLAKALERGDSLTEVIVNGRRVDYLNRYVDRSLSEPRSLRLVLPRDVLRSGENVLELKQTPERESERYESCGLLGLAIEVPR